MHQLIAVDDVEQLPPLICHRFFHPPGSSAPNKLAAPEKDPLEAASPASEHIWRFVRAYDLTGQEVLCIQVRL